MIEEKGKLSFGLDDEEMAKAGLHFGHKSSKIHPKMEPYLYGVRNGIHIIDLKKTREEFEKALKFIKNLVSDGKVLMVVGTKVQAKEAVKDFAKECKIPYVSERWLGGTFTNFEVIKKRITGFKDLQEKKEKGELDKYTKKERLKIDAQISDFERKFGGIKDLEKLPDAIFILDSEKDQIAVREAQGKGVKIIAVVDSDNDPSVADYPIPANNDAASSTKYVLDKTKDVIIKAMEAKGDKRQETSDKKPSVAASKKVMEGETGDKK